MILELNALSIYFVYNPPRVCLKVLDQTLLPQREEWIELSTVNQTVVAIQSLRVRGAPLIGVVAALSLAQSALQGASKEQLIQEAQKLLEARPTAVNLMICMQRMQEALQSLEAMSSSRAESLLFLAQSIFDEDVKLCSQMARHGSELISSGDHILTHCNTGGLATAGIGTALGILKQAQEQGKTIHVYVDETRPLLQGGRLTAWELKKLNIPFTLITDSMAGFLMLQKKINKVIVGCDRIATNGDFANKIGTYSLAVLAHYHQIPFYVAGPYTTMDWKCPTGQSIPIEQRKPEEVCGVEGSFGSVRWAPLGTPVYNPAFDVTPAELVTHWIFDFGIFNISDFKTGRVKECMP